MKLLQDSVFAFVCFLLGVYLIWQEFYQYFYVKPTHSSIKRIPMKKEFFPIVKVCVDPGFDANEIRKAGYETLYALFAGFKTEAEDIFLGWTGKDLKNPSEVMEETVTLRNNSSLIKSTIFLTYIGEDFRVEEQTERIIYPNGRCIGIPVPESMDTAMSLEIELNPMFIKESAIKELQIFLQDPGRDIKSISPTSSLSGKTFLEGYDTIHSLDISIEEQLNDCKVYDDAVDDYATCYERELVSTFTVLLNCSPPWFTDARDEICNKKFDLSSELAEAVGMVFFDLFAGTFSSNCSPPCTSITYVAKYIRSEPVVDTSRIYINIPRSVQLIQEKITVDTLSFITR